MYILAQHDLLTSLSVMGKKGFSCNETIKHTLLIAIKISKFENNFFPF